MGGPGIGMTTPVDKQQAYFKLRSKGASRAAAARTVGISPNTAKKLDDVAHPDGRVVQRERVQETLGEPIPYEFLSEEAKRAWNDFAFFQRRYLGRIPIHWQVEAAQEAVAAVESEDEEWIVINVAPGAGKSTVFTHDIPAWLTVRNRAITGLLGSAIQNTAEKYIMRLKNTFERAVPLKADARLLKLGLAVDAEATLAEDFGRFKTDGGIWAADQFVVAQLEGALTAEKEPTWSAFGRKGGVLGMRYQFVIWDDLVDPARLNSSDLIDEDREWYSDIAESRLEPGGTFILQGQRLGPNDLYGYALRMKMVPDEIDEDADLDEDLGTIQKYKHIIYKAHYEEVCQGNHKPSSPAYGEPGGCLLSPRRLRWNRLSSLMQERNARFRVVYQQEEVDPESVLVQKEWVNGTGGHVGCWDKDRDRLQVPRGLDPSKCVSFATVDPSPTQYWAIEWWLVDTSDPTRPARYLIDLERRGMGANKFLDYIVGTSEYTGFAEEWQRMSYALGIPLTHWIFEQNAAQKFFLQTDLINNWQRLHGVRFLPHTTTALNKNSEELGVQALLPGIWERGLVRLPGANGSKGRMVSMRLVDEVTTYPHSRTTDCLMAQWFAELHLPELLKFKRRHTSNTPQAQPRPSWLESEFKNTAAIAGVSLRPQIRELPLAAQRISELAMARAAS